MTYRIKSAPARIKAGEADGLAEGEFIVYPSTFTREPDSYGDVVAPGAFRESIEAWKASGDVLPGLYGHRMDDPDFFVASAIDMGEDDHGWWVRGMFDLESPKGPQVYRLAKGRRLTQLSFAFDVLEEAEVKLEDGRKANELRKLHVHEFSFVPVGANQDTSVVAVKAFTDAVRTGGPGAFRSASSDHTQTLREAREAIDLVLDSIESADTEPAVETDSSSEEGTTTKTSGTAGDNAEEPEQQAKAEDLPLPPSVLVARLALVQL